MNVHTDLINLIAAKIGAQSYVEIGVFNPEHNFNKINVPRKVGVDPDPNAGATVITTSDNFFRILKCTDGKVDLCFIDGLHHADQVKKDIENAWDRLYPGGALVLHDCNPPTEKTACVPRGAQREWCGDVYKAASSVLHPSKITVDFDYGCTVIRKVSDEALSFRDEPKSWAEFDNDRSAWLNLVTVYEANLLIGAWT